MQHMGELAALGLDARVGQRLLLRLFTAEVLSNESQGSVFKKEFTHSISPLQLSLTH